MLPDRLFSTFQTALQGLTVQREKISVAARNIANAGTTAPAGSVNEYHVQRVDTSAPGFEPFRNVFIQSLTTLKTTDERHLQRSGAVLSSPDPVRGLGPAYEVAGSASFRYEYDPTHPDADENGMVRYPDVDLVQEMTRLVSANRLYEANLSVVQAEKEIIKRSMEI